MTMLTTTKLMETKFRKKLLSNEEHLDDDDDVDDDVDDDDNDVDGDGDDDDDVDDNDVAHRSARDFLFTFRFR